LRYETSEQERVLVHRTAIVATMLGFTGCGAPKGNDSGASASTQTCDGTRPRIEALAIADGGMVNHNGTQVPSLLFSFRGIDPDGDLNRYTVDIWFDALIDGTVEHRDTHHIVPDPVALDAPNCEVVQMSTSIQISILGTDVLDLDTEYEWATRLTDAHGLHSPPVVLTATTPSNGVDNER
jgi:hypothetical protein